MIEIARHIRIFDKEPSDDLVQKRTVAVTAIAEKFEKLKYVSELLQLTNDIATAAASDTFQISEPRSLEIEALIKVGSPAFVREDEELQILVCAMLGALQNVAESTPSAHGWTGGEWIAVGLWSALSFQSASRKPRLEALRSELVNASRDLVMRASQAARARQPVPDFALKVGESVDVNKLPESIKSGVSKTIEALRTNAALDREEIDLLWWTLSNWSALLNESFAHLSDAASAVTAGVEAGRLIRRLPSESHKHLVFRHITTKRKLTLEALVAELAKHVEPINQAFAGNGTFESCPAVFPLLTSLRRGTTSDKKLRLEDWGARALLESSILHIAGLGSTLE